MRPVLAAKNDRNIHISGSAALCAFQVVLICVSVNAFRSMDWNSHHIATSMTSGPLSPSLLMAISSVLMMGVRAGVEG